MSAGGGEGHGGGVPGGGPQGNGMQGGGPRDDDLAEALIGSWYLVSWESVGEDGSVELPMGEAPEGFLVYTPDGEVITTIGRAGRPPISAGDMLSGPADERLAAMAGFIAFSGTFQTEGGDVLHEVRMSLFPNWVGGVQRRHTSLSPDARRLTLSTDLMTVRGRAGRHRLVWQRASIVLQPRTVVDASQAWFWKDAWQAGEQEASADIQAGNTRRFESDKDFIDSLG